MDAPKIEEDPKAKARREEEEKVREVAIKPGLSELKGGRGQGSGGEQFGLKW